MADLELVGLHADGEHLVLAGPDGHRHRVVIDDALRAAVRHDRPRLEQVRVASLVRPREIQSRIRAGESPADIARDAGVPVEQIRRYESPVTAERNWVAEQARQLPLGRESDAPRLGELVVDRLARRGVEPGDLSWTAVRRPGEGWELVLEFRAGDRDRQARWGVDIPTRALHALDDESRWLSETDLGSADARRHLSAVQSRVYDVEVDTADPATDAPHWASSRPRRGHAETHASTRRPVQHPEADADTDTDAGSGNLDRAQKAQADARIAERIRRGKADEGPVAAAPSGAAAEATTEAAGRGDTTAPPAVPESVTASASFPETPKTPEPADDPRYEADRRTAELLEGLRASRGVRQELGRLEEEDDEDEAQRGGASAAQTPAVRAKERPPATVRQLRPVPATQPPHESDEALANTDPGPVAGAASGSARDTASVAPTPTADTDPSAGRTSPAAEVPQTPKPTTQAPATSAPSAAEPVAEVGSAVEPAAAAPAPGSATGSRPVTSSSARRPDASQKAEPRPQPGPARRRPEAARPAADDDQETAILAPVLPPGDPARKARSKSRRTSVPSWDEIVFGAKPE